MSAFLLAAAIGTLLGHYGRMPSWMAGSFLIAFVVAAGVWAGGLTAGTLLAACLTVIGFNVGLASGIACSIAPGTKKPT